MSRKCDNRQPGKLSMSASTQTLGVLPKRAGIATSARRAFRENLLLALDTLRTYKFRSLLTVLGVLIGTATVIGVASIFKGLDQQVVDLA